MFDNQPFTGISSMFLAEKRDAASTEVIPQEGGKRKTGRDNTTARSTERFSSAAKKGGVEWNQRRGGREGKGWDSIYTQEKETCSPTMPRGERRSKKTRRKGDKEKKKKKKRKGKTETSNVRRDR